MASPSTPSASSKRARDAAPSSSPLPPTIIGLIGKKRSGKDTIAARLVARHGFSQYAFADPLKDACKVMFGFSDAQVHGDELKEVEDERWGISPRRVLQLVGTELMRSRFMELAPQVKDHIKQGFWVHRLRLFYEQWRRENPGGSLVVSDLRFQDEADVIVALGGVVVRVNRDGEGAAEALASAAEKGAVHAHKSEQVDGITGVSRTVDNTGTLEDLAAAVDRLVAELADDDGGDRPATPAPLPSPGAGQPAASSASAAATARSSTPSAAVAPDAKRRRVEQMDDAAAAAAAAADTATA